MKPSARFSSQQMGSALVALQFVLLAALGWEGGPALFRHDAGHAAWIAMVAGAAVGVWSVTANRPGNFNIRPTPHERGALVMSGPYRWIRHPMYSALMLLGLACVLAAQDLWLSMAMLAGLTGVLITKALLEEHWMTLRHPAYEAYRACTWRFVPGLC